MEPFDVLQQTQLVLHVSWKHELPGCLGERDVGRGSAPTKRTDHINWESNHLCAWVLATCHGRMLSYAITAVKVAWSEESLPRVGDLLAVRQRMGRRDRRVFETGEELCFDRHCP